MTSKAKTVAKERIKEIFFRKCRAPFIWQKSGQKMSVLMINRTFYLKFHHQLMSHIYISFFSLSLLPCFLFLLLTFSVCLLWKNNWFFPPIKCSLVQLNSTSIRSANGESSFIHHIDELKRVLHTINLFPVFSFFSTLAKTTRS